MESANIHHPLYEYELVGSSSSSLATTTHAWNTLNSIVSTNSLSSSYPNETSSLNQRQEVNTSSPLSSLSYNPTSMAPDSSFNYWYNPNFTINQSAEDLQISRIKEELSDIYYLKYNELINNSPSSSSNDQEPGQLIRSEQRINHLRVPNDHHLSTKLLLKSLPSGNLLNKAHEGDQLLFSSNGGKGYNQVFPSVPVSSFLNQTGFNTSQGPSLDMNLEALDLLSSSRFSGSFMNSSLGNPIGMLRDGFSYGFGHHMQQESHHQFPIYNSINDKISSSSNGAAEAKRNSSKMDSSKPMNQTSTKKPRLETRASCPPLKVRKEKLGDRIAALQQLVAPFGKTDTASVLMEAIGYIKFLQNQVETLSVPYMKAARSKSHRSIKEDHVENKEVLEEKGQKRDLKSRGLCLVPMSCLSYITDGGGGGGGGGAAVWPPSHFCGTTERYHQ